MGGFAVTMEKTLGWRNKGGPSQKQNICKATQRVVGGGDPRCAALATSTSGPAWWLRRVSMHAKAQTSRAVGT